MTNKQASALIEAIKILNESLHDPEKLKAALERIQSRLENPK